MDPRLLLVVFVNFDIFNDENDHRYHTSYLNEEEGVGLPDEASSVWVTYPHTLILSPPTIWVQRAATFLTIVYTIFVIDLIIPYIIEFFQGWSFDDLATLKKRLGERFLLVIQLAFTYFNGE